MPQQHRIYAIKDMWSDFRVWNESFNDDLTLEVWLPFKVITHPWVKDLSIKSHLKVNIHDDDMDMNFDQVCIVT